MFSKQRVAAFAVQSPFTLTLIMHRGVQRAIPSQECVCKVNMSSTAEYCEMKNKSIKSNAVMIHFASVSFFVNHLHSPHKGMAFSLFKER